MEYATVPVNEIVHSRYSSEYSRSYSQDTFLELTNSIRAMGIHNPICVTRKNQRKTYCHTIDTNTVGQHFTFDKIFLCTWINHRSQGISYQFWI